MIKLNIKAEDFEGNVRDEEVYFHLNKNELTEMQLAHGGKLEQKMQELAESEDVEGIYEFVKELMIKAYGVRSTNGQAFIKRPEDVEEFRYGYKLPECMVELMKDETGKKILNFIKGIMPVSTQKAIDKEIQNNPKFAKHFK